MLNSRSELNLEINIYRQKNKTVLGDGHIAEK